MFLPPKLTNIEVMCWNERNRSVHIWKFCKHDTHPQMVQIWLNLVDKMRVLEHIVNESGIYV